MISLLKTFSEEEWKHFSLFLQSPYFNRSPAVLRLFGYLSRFRPGLDSPKLSKEKAFAAAYGKKQAYRESKANDLMYKLKGLAEAFLAHDELKSRSALREQQLAGLLSRRPGAYSHFEKAAKKALQQTARHPESLEKHWALLWLNHLAFHHPEKPADLGRQPESIIKAMEELDQLYLYAKFRYSTELLSRKKFLEEQPAIFLLDACLEAVNQGLDCHSIIQLHYWLAKLSGGTSNGYVYQKAKQLLQANLKELGPIEKLSAYLHLINYVIGRSNEEAEPWAKKLHDLYLLGLDERILTHGNTLSKSTFLNIAINAAALREFRFASSFIIDYKEYLLPEVQEEAFLLALAYLRFHEGRYAEANQLLQQAPYASPDFRIRSFSIRARCLYQFFIADDTYEDTLLSCCKQFYYYLKNDVRWANEKKERYLNFIVVAEQLVDFKTARKTGPKYQEALKQLIAEKEPVYLKEWLLEKIGTLDAP